MIALYLYINTFLYLLLAVWCIVKFEGTSSFLGFSFSNNSGKVEYLTIYTGLQAGLALFLGFSGYYESLNIAGLVLCVAMYGCIVVTRTTTAIYYGNLTKATYMVGGLEYVLGIWGVVLLFCY
jgi:hypothetical protein